MYRWVGWFGPEDCEPPEPGKYWIEIQDEDFNEFAIIVYRPQGEDLEIFERGMMPTQGQIEREHRANYIVDALNFRSVEYETPV